MISINYHHRPRCIVFGKASRHPDCIQRRHLTVAEPSNSTDLTSEKSLAYSSSRSLNPTVRGNPPFYYIIDGSCGADRPGSLIKSPNKRQRRPLEEKVFKPTQNSVKKKETMCQQFLTLYDWCQCEVDSGHKACGVGQPNARCEGTAFETVRMQCFCNNHATKKFMSEKKHQRKQSRSSTSSTSSGSSRNSRYSDVSLDQVKDPQQGPVLRKRWYHMWSRSP